MLEEWIDSESRIGWILGILERAEVVFWLVIFNFALLGLKLLELMVREPVADAGKSKSRPNSSVAQADHPMKPGRVPEHDGTAE